MQTKFTKTISENKIINIVYHLLIYYFIFITSVDALFRNINYSYVFFYMFFSILLINGIIFILMFAKLLNKNIIFIINSTFGLGLIFFIFYQNLTLPRNIIFNFGNFVLFTIPIILFLFILIMKIKYNKVE